MSTAAIIETAAPRDRPAAAPRPDHGVDPWRQPRLPSLDGLRFVAAVLVIVYHGGCEAPAPDGVTFFFVLSGFLFGWLLDREFQRTGTVALGSFYVRRAIRILPAFYAALAITLVGKRLLGNPISFGHAAASAVFVGNYYNALHDHPATGFSHFWSLAVEEQFYVIWPVVFLILSRRGRGRLFVFLAAAIAGVAAWRIGWLWSGLASTAYVYNTFECRFDSLAVGCLLGLLASSQRFQRCIAASCPTGLEPAVLTGCLVVTAAQSAAYRYGPGFTVDSALMGLVMLQLVVLGKHPLWRWLNWKPIAFLGSLSYSAYLLHPWGLALASKVPGLSDAKRIALGVPVTMLLAWGLYVLVERPALAWRERFRSAGS